MLNIYRQTGWLMHFRILRFRHMYFHFRLPLLESAALLGVLFLEPFVSIHPTVHKCRHARKKAKVNATEGGKRGLRSRVWSRKKKGR